MNSISVVICTKDRPDSVNRLVNALKKQSFKDFETIVVDTGNKETEKVCKDQSVKYIKETRPGRCLARNIGIENAKGDIIFFFDDDTAPEENYIKKIMKHFDDESVVGAGGREITVIENGRASMSLLSKFEAVLVYILNPFIKNKEIGIIRPSGRATANFNMDPGHTVDVMYLKGFAMAFRKNALLRAGMFDEWYDRVAHREENDICARIIKKGYRIVYDPSAVVKHYHSEAGRSDHYTAMYCMYKQHQYFVFKNDMLKGFGWIEYLFGEALESMMIFIKLFIYKDWRFLGLFRAKYEGIREGLRRKWMA